VPAGFDNSELLDYYHALWSESLYRQSSRAPQPCIVWKKRCHEGSQLPNCGRSDMGIAGGDRYHNDLVSSWDMDRTSARRGLPYSPPFIPHPSTAGPLPIFLERLSSCRITPNPFIPLRSFGYKLPKASHVTLRVYNLLGRK